MAKSNGDERLVARVRSVLDVQKPLTVEKALRNISSCYRPYGCPSCRKELKKAEAYAAKLKETTHDDK